MIYVMSDIHGEYEKYIRMLAHINFTDDDTLYILGDVIDRGAEPVRILKDILMRPNVYPILGNHEVMARDVLRELMVEITEQNCEEHITADTISKLMEWQENGGNITLEQFKALSHDDREILLDYFEEFSTLEVVDVGKKTYVLVHSGFAMYDPHKSLEDYTPEEVAFIRPNYDINVFRRKSVYVVSGHTPTFYLSGKNEIFKANNNICIDCGATFGGKLACLRLDDLAEFYV